jgi:hypothetical protein
MKTITLNPTDIEGFEQYIETFWIPSIEEYRELAVWCEVDGSFAFDYGNGARYGTGFGTAQMAYEVGITSVRDTHSDATDIQ